MLVHRDSVLLDLPRCDPGALIRDGLTADRSALGARDLLLCWLLRLAPGVDAADAARVLIHAYGDLPRRSAAATELFVLLRETAQWPRQRLARLQRPRSVP